MPRRMSLEDDMSTTIARLFPRASAMSVTGLIHFMAKDPPGGLPFFSNVGTLNADTPFSCPLAAIKKTQSSPAMARR
jgi:hypothetical protein